MHFVKHTQVMIRMREADANTGGSDMHSIGYNGAEHGTLDISPSSSKRQIITSYTNGNEEVQSVELKTPATRRIMVVDDDPDITLTFKKAFEAENENNNNKISFVVSTYNDPLLALAEFRPGFYDLLLVDINMPKMNGFDFCVKVLEIDVNPRVCFMSSGLINQEALREQYPALSIGCFIRKPVSISYLVRKVKAETQ
jgi:CheY-like chemotaxis protein